MSTARDYAAYNDEWGNSLNSAIGFPGRSFIQRVTSAGCDEEFLGSNAS